MYGVAGREKYTQFEGSISHKDMRSEEVQYRVYKVYIG